MTRKIAALPSEATISSKLNPATQDRELDDTHGKVSIVRPGIGAVSCVMIVSRNVLLHLPIFINKSLAAQCRMGHP
jgi:hypothetical protein